MNTNFTTTCANCGVTGGFVDRVVNGTEQISRFTYNDEREACTCGCGQRYGRVYISCDKCGAEETVLDS